MQKSKFASPLLPSFINPMQKRNTLSADRYFTPAVLTGLSWLGCLLLSKPAMAHHVTGSRIPDNFSEGFLSGLAHPIIGLDHLAFVIAIGLLSAGRVRGVWIPVFFLLAALAGAGIYLLKVSLPTTEVAISLSVLTLGIVLVLGKQASLPVLAAIAAISGVFHGYAYGEAIVGAGMTPLVAYLAGFTLIQYAIATLSMAVGNLVFRRTKNPPTPMLQFSGYAICLVGAVFLTTSL